MNTLSRISVIWLILSAACLMIPTALADGSQAAGSTTTEGGKFRVSYQSKIDPLPLNRIHSWVLQVKTLDGKPVENATIAIYGGMPAHRHGLPTQPKANEIGDGAYLVQGVKFSMTGLWEMWFDIRAEGLSDKAKFVVEI